MGRGLALVLGAGIALAVLVPAVVLAQDDEPSPSEVALAREQFEQGMAFARQGHWAEAYTAFSRAYAITHRPLILLNLASAEGQTGRLVEAAESYRRFLREVTAGRDTRHRPDAERALDELELRIPRARFMIEGLARRDAIELDGQPISQAAIGAPLPVNPGPHLLVVRAGDVELARRTFEMPEGQGQDVGVTLDRSRIPVVRPDGTPDPGPGPGDGAEPSRGPAPIPSPTGPDRVRDGDEEGGGGVLASPVFWTVVGVLVVGGVGAGILLSSGGGPDPHDGTLDPGGFTF